MEDLIKALNILLKYGNPSHPFHCEHDTLYIWGIEPSEVSEDDLKSLEELGFFVSEDVDDGIMSFKYGSC